MRHNLSACAVLLALVASPSFAQETGRFQLQQLGEDSYVILDTQTGHMEQCQQRQRKLVCGPLRSPAQGQESASSSLEGRIAELEARITALESGRPAASLPNEEEFEQTLGYMERFFRRFMDIVSDLERRADPEPPADRT